MKVIAHVEQLLRQGHKPKELIALGFPKSVVTRVRRQLREEKAALHSGTQEGRAGAESHPQPVESGSLEDKTRWLESRVKVLETINAEIEELKTRLDGTPALGLRQRFKCDCGASGFVAMRIQCTKCGKETWWGWFPKE
jgi:hypothetical protein